MHRCPSEQFGVEVDDPLRLTKAPGVGLIRGDLGLGHVVPESLECSGEDASPASAGADHEK